MKNKWN